MRKGFIVFGILFLFLISGVSAAIINVASCEQVEVQNAIDSASSGDTLNIPPGSCVWTSPNSWTGAVIIPSTKKLVLSGAGIGLTTITSTTNIRLFDITSSASRVTGFTFILGHIKAYGQGWRIDHNRFDGSALSGSICLSTLAIGADVTSAGLFDHNQVHNQRVGTAQGPSLLAHGRWARATRSTVEIDGKVIPEVVVIEDNIYTHDGATGIQFIDSNYGGGYVARFNTIHDASIMAHAVQGNNRATRVWDVHNNIWVKTGPMGIMTGFIRAGTGMWFNNEVVGAWPYPDIWMDEQRSCGAEPEPIGKCNGSSVWDGNQVGEAGYPCRDQIGRGIDVPQWVSTPGSEGAYAQALEPVYSWSGYMYPTEEDRIAKTNGVANGIGIKSGICDEAKAHLQENRDWYNFNTNFDGTTGVGVGIADTMNAIKTCTDGVGFWVTNEGEWDSTNGATADGRLYVCDTNAWELNYIPYQYPHPLALSTPPPTTCSVADTSGNNIVEIGELINYISQWKLGDVVIGDLITAIGEWKNGC